ncbi:MAG: 30S ribosomal protein S2 [Candidatus Woesearchaeota archaeon]
MADDQELLVAPDVYLKAGAHIGTKFKTGYMKEFIYKTRADGLSLMNIPKMDDRLKKAVNMVSNYDPKNVIIVSQRENGWDAIKLFSKITGVKYFPGRYPPGVLTNASLDNFQEAELIIVLDPFTDKNAVQDARKIGIPVIGFVDTNNTFNNLDLVIPTNNKGRKSLNFMLYLLAREVALKRGTIQTDGEIGMSYEDVLEDDLKILNDSDE